MGFLFRKRIKLFPGITINLSKPGASTPIGRRGAKLNFGKRATMVMVGLPGTGVTYSPPLGNAAPALQPNPKSTGTRVGTVLVGAIVLLALLVWVIG